MPYRESGPDVLLGADDEQFSEIDNGDVPCEESPDSYGREHLREHSILECEDSLTNSPQQENSSGESSNAKSTPQFNPANEPRVGAASRPIQSNNCEDSDTTTS